MSRPQGPAGTGPSGKAGTHPSGWAGTRPGTRSTVVLSQDNDGDDDAGEE